MLLELLLPAWVGFGIPVQRPMPLSLSWEAPAVCPDDDALRERIESLVPGLLDDSHLDNASVYVFVEAVDAHFEARIEIETEDGRSSRELVSTKCETVADATALLITVVLDPIRSAASLQPWTAEEPAAKPSEEAAPDDERDLDVSPPAPPFVPVPVELDGESDKSTTNVVTAPAVSPRPTRARPRFGLRLGGGGGYGPTNTGYGVIGGALALFGNRWRAELATTWSITREVSEPDGVGGRFDAWTIVPRGCFVPTAQRFEFPLCLGLELGQVRGRGLPSLPLSLEAEALWLAPALGQGLYFSPLEGLALGLEVDLAVPLNRGAFSVAERSIQAIAPVRVRALLGIEIRL